MFYCTRTKSIISSHFIIFSENFYFKLSLIKMSEYHKYSQCIFNFQEQFNNHTGRYYGSNSTLRFNFEQIHSSDYLVNLETVHHPNGKDIRSPTQQTWRNSFKKLVLPLILLTTEPSNKSLLCGNRNDNQFYALCNCLHFNSH